MATVLIHSFRVKEFSDLWNTSGPKGFGSTVFEVQYFSFTVVRNRAGHMESSALT